MFVSLSEKFSEIITPGRKRLLEKSSKKDSVEWEFNQDIYESSEFKNGTKVFHQKYGYGSVIDIEGDVASVKFNKSSTKKIFVKYLKLVS